MRLVHNERNGEAFDSQLVIGVRESYVNLCSNTQDKLQVSLILLLFKLTITSLLLINITVRLLKVLCDRFSFKSSPVYCFGWFSSKRLIFYKAMKGQMSKETFNLYFFGRSIIFLFPDIPGQLWAGVHRSNGAVLQREGSRPAEPAQGLCLQLHEVRRSKAQGGGTESAQVPGNERNWTRPIWVRYTY